MPPFFGCVLQSVGEEQFDRSMGRSVFNQNGNIVEQNPISVRTRANVRESLASFPCKILAWYEFDGSSTSEAIRRKL